MANEIGTAGRDDAWGTFGQWMGLAGSGLLLVVFVTAHLWGVHYAGYAGEERYTFENVSTRMANPAYRSFILLLLVVSLFHGLVGMRRVLDDFGLRGAAAKRVVNVTLWGAGLVGLAYGLMIFRALSA